MAALTYAAYDKGGILKEVAPLFYARIDSTQYTAKPEGAEKGAVSNAIAKAEFKPYRPAQLARAIACGATVCPADFEGETRKKETWRAQQLWFVDVDNDAPTEGRTLREVDAVRRAISNGLPLLMAYQSFSGDATAGIDHAGQGEPGAERYRLVFAKKKVVTDRAQAEQFGGLLLHVYPEADQTTVQLNRLFYGTDKPVEVITTWGTC